MVFSFDVQKTLELHHCDPEDYTHISEEVHNFPLHKYVGILVNVRGLMFSTSPALLIMTVSVWF